VGRDAGMMHSLEAVLAMSAEDLAALQMDFVGTAVTFDADQRRLQLVEVSEYGVMASLACFEHWQIYML
jgi:hypothetical protein